MRNLIPVEEDPIEVYGSIANNCIGDKKQKLLEIQREIEQHYGRYSANKYKLEFLNQQEYREPYKTYLLSCYGQNVNLSKLKKRIKENQELALRAKCIYCGINSPGTFDHYLPKEDYPEFAVLSMNLIPCCEKCNSKKGKRWKTGADLRIFLNLYYDIIPDEQFLFASLAYHDQSHVPTVDFYLQLADSIGTNLSSMITSHYEHLNLLNRFEDHANDELSNIYIQTIEAIQEGVSVEIQKATLQRTYNANVRRLGRNHWQSVLYETVIHSESFFKSCVHKQEVGRM
ncbi:HNH endonuclease [Bacillus cereus group sp. MYBK77-1]|uniref:HNH endonuclease n=1 Tax=Bacillus cereus group TaxID=86661 RepID=UPI00016B943F|nr:MULTISPECIES: HNH endonuclease [Bacillus cereus group]EDZ59145.1 conserved hypothetical protein [Bacillus cereus H3081.97]KKZ96516.1 hypothetical protein B4086_2795 [Bacillus cereus]KXI72444.1 hypothetical protein ACS51_01160 [Bacillus cereus]MCC2432466.1 HNH endonuclease [Bacillus paranthracis]MDX5914431.1 HNH endonuclease [Bacillus cereus group sp. BfR-BA-01026]